MYHIESNLTVIRDADLNVRIAVGTYGLRNWVRKFVHNSPESSKDSEFRILSLVLRDFD
jgi:hypothetical protein